MKKKHQYGLMIGLFVAAVICLGIFNKEIQKGRTKENISKNLPIVQEKISFTFLANMAMDLLQVCDGDLNNSVFYKELEERTNIHIDWVNSQDELNLQYHLGQSGSREPDILDISSLKATLDDLIDSGNILDLTTLIPQYAPNYYRIIQQEEELRNMAYTNTGRIAAVYSIKQKKQKPWAGLQIRKDWLEDLQLEMPETFEELEHILMEFKEKKGATAPLLLPPYGYIFSNDLNAGFQVSTDFFHIGDKVYYGPAEKGWKEYLQLMNRWYKKGLISPNFATATNVYADAQMVSSGAAGVWFGMYTFPADCSFAEKNAEVAAVGMLKKKKEDEIHIRMQDSFSDNGLALSSDCEHPEIVLQWIDYLFSEEGALFANYGIEGLTYEKDQTGNPVFTKLITDNPQGLTYNQAMKKYTFPPGAASAYVDWERESKLFPAEDVAMCDIGAQAGTEYMLPSNLSFTWEENSRITELKNQLSACMNQYTVQFIMGVTPFEKYDDYLKELKKNGLDEVLQIYQGAYDRCKL